MEDNVSWPSHSNDRMETLVEPFIGHWSINMTKICQFSQPYSQYSVQSRASDGAVYSLSLTLSPTQCSNNQYILLTNHTTNILSSSTLKTVFRCFLRHTFPRSFFSTISLGLFIWHQPYLVSQFFTLCVAEHTIFWWYMQTIRLKKRNNTRS